MFAVTASQAAGNRDEIERLTVADVKHGQIDPEALETAKAFYRDYVNPKTEEDYAKHTQAVAAAMFGPGAQIYQNTPFSNAPSPNTNYATQPLSYSHRMFGTGSDPGGKFEGQQNIINEIRAGHALSVFLGPREVTQVKPYHNMTTHTATFPDAYNDMQQQIIMKQSKHMHISSAESDPLTNLVFPLEFVKNNYAGVRVEITEYLAHYLDRRAPETPTSQVEERKRYKSSKPMHFGKLMAADLLIFDTDMGLAFVMTKANQIYIAAQRTTNLICAQALINAASPSWGVVDQKSMTINQSPTFTQREFEAILRYEAVNFGILNMPTRQLGATQMQLVCKNFEEKFHHRDVSCSPSSLLMVADPATAIAIKNSQNQAFFITGKTPKFTTVTNDIIQSPGCYGVMLLKSFPNGNGGSLQNLLRRDATFGEYVLMDGCPRSIHIDYGKHSQVSDCDVKIYNTERGDFTEISYKDMLKKAFTLAQAVNGDDLKYIESVKEKWTKHLPDIITSKVRSSSFTLAFGALEDHKAGNTIPAYALKSMNTEITQLVQAVPDEGKLQELGSALKKKIIEIIKAVSNRDELRTVAKDLVDLNIPPMIPVLLARPHITHKTSSVIGVVINKQSPPGKLISDMQNCTGGVDATNKSFVYHYTVNIAVIAIDETRFMRQDNAFIHEYLYGSGVQVYEYNDHLAYKKNQLFDKDIFPLLLSPAKAAELEQNFYIDIAGERPYLSGVPGNYSEFATGYATLFGWLKSDYGFQQRAAPSGMSVKRKQTICYEGASIAKDWKNGGCCWDIKREGSGPRKGKHGAGAIDVYNGHEVFFTPTISTHVGSSSVNISSF
jgi:hypothetical protein